MTESLESCLFLTEEGELIQVFCPFKVIAMTSINGILQGDVLLVEAVKTTTENHIVFQINKEYYFHRYFKLLL